MKKLITTCLVLAALSSASFAQSKATKTSAATKASSSSATTKATKSSSTSAEALAEKSAQEAKKTYGLDDQQYKGIYETELYYQNQVNSMKGYTPGEGQIMQMNMAKDMGYQKFLTPAQYEKYESTKANK